MGAEGQKTDKLHKGRSDRLWDSRCYEFNNGGYSIIELIIVLAIIAIIISTVFYSIILVFSANAKSCANNLQRSIGDCKVTTMGKSAAYMELYRDADQNVYTRMYVMDSGGSYVPSEPQKVGTSRVYVAYTPEGGAETELLAGDKIEIRFDRASGGFEEDASGNIYEKLHVQGGSKKYEIVLTKLTGKSEVNLVP